ncbi:hypothetical protein FOZ60_004944 [Perkinsus olseni]|uniref:Uncharacterized protein n=1 Tax=Perkinsus olseni TaxID=32597 RepID=A0A7J6NUI1_PEROL|nr:hypothetical protein FOZ60_004944 [Perkinsus olseni]
MEKLSAKDQQIIDLVSELAAAKAQLAEANLPSVLAKKRRPDTGVDSLRHSVVSDAGGTDNESVFTSSDWNPDIDKEDAALKDIKDTVLGVLREERILSSFVSRGGLALSFSSEQDLNSARDKLSRSDDDLAFKTTSGKETLVRLMCPSESNGELSVKGDRQTFLANSSKFLCDIAVRNGVPTDGVSIVRRSQGGVIFIKGPSHVLTSWLAKAHLYTGLSRVQVKRASSDALCFTCGAYHPRIPGSRCPRAPKCVKCGGDHPLAECTCPRDFAGPDRSCSNCGATGHSALNYKCQPIKLQPVREEGSPTTPRPLKVVVHNINRSLDALSEWLRAADFDVVLLQECPPSLSRRSSYLNYNIILSEPNPGARGRATDWHRAAILHSKDLPVVSSYACPDLASAVLRVNDTLSIRFISFYGDSSLPMEDAINSLARCCESAPALPILAGGDSNAFSPLWFSPYHPPSDPRVGRGALLERFVLSNGFNICSRNKDIPSFQGAQGSSFIDLAFARELTVDPLEPIQTLSDHLALPLLIIPTPSPSQSYPKRRSPRDTDWDAFSRHLESFNRTAPLISSTEDIERLAVSLADDVQVAVRLSTPSRKPPSPAQLRARNGESWWNEQLEKQRKALRNLQAKIRRLRKRTDPPHDQIRVLEAQFVHSKKRYYRDIKVAKRNAWRTEMANLTAHELNKRFKPRKVANETYDPCELLNHFISSPGESPEFASPLGSVETSGSLNGLGGPVTAQELSDAIRGFPNGKSPGADQVSYEHLKRAVENPSWRNRMLLLANACLDRCFVPNCLKNSSLIMLYKGGNKPRLKRWRPIALLPVLLKVLEKLIGGRLKAMIKLPDNLHGFIPNRSTTSALRAVTASLEDSAHRYKLLATFDVSSAFDRVDHRGLVRAVTELSSPAMGKLISSYSHGHTVTLDGHSRNRVRGVPQGSSLGPLLYAIATVSLSQYISRTSDDLAATGVRISAELYADDTAVVISSDCSRTAVAALAAVASTIKEWATRFGLELDLAKTEILVADDDTRVTIADRLADSAVDGLSRDHCKPSIIWLGVTISRNWRSHIWKAQGKDTVVGLEAFFSKWLFGLNRSAPNELTSFVLGTITPSITQLPGLRRSELSALRRCGFDKGSYFEPSRTPTAPLPPNFRSTLHFYTDGSLSDKTPLAAKVTGYRGCRLDDRLTIFQAELCGALLVIDWCLERLEHSRRLPPSIVVHVDSRSVLQSLASGRKGTILLNTFWSRVDTLLRRSPETTLSFHWTPGHSGVVGNEAADVVARLFSRSPRPDHLSTLKLGPLPELPVSHSRNKASVRSKVWRQSRWSERLPHLAAGRFGLSLGPSQFARITRTIIDWKMSDRRRVMEFITGHSPTRSFIGHLRPGMPTGCRHCKGARETLVHFLSCPSPRLESIRLRIWGTHYPGGVDPDWQTALDYRFAKSLLAGCRSDLLSLRSFLRWVAPSWDSYGYTTRSTPHGNGM